MPGPAGPGGSAWPVPDQRRDPARCQPAALLCPLLPPRWPRWDAPAITRADEAQKPGSRPTSTGLMSAQDSGSAQGGSIGGLGGPSPADPSAHAMAVQPFSAFLGRCRGAGYRPVTAGALAPQQIQGRSVTQCSEAPPEAACPRLHLRSAPSSPLPARPRHWLGQREGLASVPWGPGGWAGQ